MRYSDYADAFWARVEKTDTCWLWKGVAYKGGGAAFNVMGRWRSAASFSWGLLRESAPENTKFRRTCQNKRCVNPEHLYPQKEGPPSPEPGFWRRVEKTETCWLWRGKKFENGYGLLVYKKKDIRAHRLSWELHNGPIPSGLFVLHKCDVRACVRPDHLWLGTNMDNIIDMHIKGRGRVVPKPKNYLDRSLVLLDGAGI